MRQLAVFSGGFLSQKRVRRILKLAGWRVRVGIIPGRTAAVGVWGRRPVSWRGIAAARRFGLPIVSVEDAFLRSVEPGRRAGPGIGLMIDEIGLHFDSSRASSIEMLLAKEDLSDPDLMAEARRGIALMRGEKLSKYNAFTAPPPEGTGYVLVIDQTRGDASIAHGAATAETFAKMLAEARRDHPDTPIVIRTHLETAQGRKLGHFGPEDLDDRTVLSTDPINPWDHLNGAVAVYCVTSQMGFEAILAGHRPVVFGLPFFAGWGLSDDRQSCPRRGRKRTAEELFAAAMLRAPCWYDPFHDRLARFEDAARAVLAGTRAWSENRAHPILLGMSRWKHPSLKRFFRGPNGRPDFAEAPHDALERAAATGRPVYVWAGKETEALRVEAAARGVTLARIEDGFIRSIGLGARLLPAASLVVDDLGIYFDPSRPSRLEALINAAPHLSDDALARARRLRLRLIESGVSKYNVGNQDAPPRARPGQKTILVPGQVEDDASIRLGAGPIRTNLGLLKAARAANPDALVLYKPHPDIEAGLRDGAVPPEALAELADHVAVDAAPAPLIEAADEVWTMTSLMGFEALIRGKTVHCLGQPFYAGWGLTQDHDQGFARRHARPALDALVHAVMIDYPRYIDPVTNLPCPAEVVLERLASRHPRMVRHPTRKLRRLAWLQDRLRRFAPMWRK